MPAAFVRRLISISAVAVVASLTWGLLPLWLALAALIDALRWRSGKGLATLRLLAYGCCFLAIEVVALLGLGAGGVATLGSTERRRAAAYALQRRYVAANLAAVRWAFDLRFEVDGEPSPSQRAGPLTVFVRHASLIDVLVPGVFVANRFALRLRYVLKRELLWEPCLDIAGHWMPNHFVDRSGATTERELDAIRALQAGLGPGEGVLLYPEGTRFTVAKRQRLLEKVAGDTDATEQARKLRHLLPMRPGGALALLEATPARDVLFVGHIGLEGFASLGDIWAGALVHRVVRIRFWWEPAGSVPCSEHERLVWLADHWQRLDDWLESAEPSPASNAA